MTIRVPCTKKQWFVVVLLVAVIAVAGSIVVAKASRSIYLRGKWAWEHRLLLFPEEPLDRSKVVKYRDRPRQIAKIKPDGPSASFRWSIPHNMANPDGYAITNVTGGNSWNFTLAIDNLDRLMKERVDISSIYAEAYAFGAEARIVIDDVGYVTYVDPSPPLPASWPEDAQDAWDAWIALIPPAPDGWGLRYGYNFLLKAEAVAGDIADPDNYFEDHKYLVVGWVYYVDLADEMGDWQYRWVGESQWVLEGQFFLSNVVARERITTATSSRYVTPRSWRHRNGDMAWFTSSDPETPTMTEARLDDLSVSALWTGDFDENGQIDVTGAGFNFLGTVGFGGQNVEVDTPYCEIRNLTCTSEGVAANCYNSYWSTADSADDYDGDWGPASVEAPEGAVWHAYNEGNTLTVRRVSGVGLASAYMGWNISFAGPVRVNCCPGRGGHGSDFPVAGGWRCDLGVRRYINQTETEIVWFYEGLSDWIKESYIWRRYADPSDRLRAGETNLPAIGGTVDEDWLTANGELLTLSEIGGEVIPEISNRQVKVVSPPLNDAQNGDYWGPAIAITRNEISADIPPDETERPSPWEAGTGAAIDGTYNDRWTITGATGKITRTLLSRYDARLAYLESGYSVGDDPYVDDWILMARANFWLDSDPAEVAAACAKEDVTNYDNARCVVFSFADGYPAGLTDNWQASAILKLTYATYDLSDSCYYPAQHDGIDLRFGSEGFFEYTKTVNTVEIKGEKITGDDTSTRLKFDLGKLRRTKGVDLRHVTQIELTLPKGEFRLVDMRLPVDPDDHGYGASYPGLVIQPATDPWNWHQCGMGMGATFEGVPCLNIPEGTESTPFSEDVQWGIKQTQFLQWNPLWLADQEEPPTYDPTYARNLNVRILQILNRQEQITATLLPIVAEATQDDDGNSLGFLYPWDLQRENSDDSSLNAAIHVASFNTGSLPLCAVTLKVVWITHGRSQGMAYQNGSIVRGNGGSYDDSTGRANLYRQAVDDDGVPIGKWEVCGSFTPGPTGRWVSPPAKENGYIYGTKAASSDTEPTSSTNFVTREYADLLAWFKSGGELYVVEQMPSMIYLLEYRPGNGIKIIYTSDPGQYLRDGKSLGNFQNPYQLVEDEDTDGCPSGYVDKMAVLRVYHLKDGDLKRLVSNNWGSSWEEETTVISGENIAKSVEAYHEGRQYCIGVDSSGNLYCYASNSHFDDAAWTLNTNKFLIVTGADTETMPSFYTAHGKFYAYAFVGDDRKGWTSDNFGRTWTEIGA